jgi:hypothetical protein
MSAPLIRTTDRIEVVYPGDASVTIADPTHPAWVDASRTQHATEAVVATIRPLDYLEVSTLPASDAPGLWTQACEAAGRGLVSLRGPGLQGAPLVALKLLPFPWVRDLGRTVLTLSMGHACPFVAGESEP